MTDVFVLLQLPNAGDDLQGIKKGIVELADIVTFNKADIDPRAADIACGQMRSALHMLRPLSTHWQIPVLKISAAKKEGLTEFWQTIETYRQTMQECGEFDAKRKRQALAWMWDMIETGLHQRFREHPLVKQQLAAVAHAVTHEKITPAAGAQQLLGYLK
jgi:LAO/AO transport system kinase